MKIAFFTPWPPNYSGIAEYAFGIVEGLSRFHEIIVIHEKNSNEDILTLPNVTFSSWKDSNISTLLKNVSLFIFQFGNNFECHGFILNFLNYSVPKVLHLHDLALCHFYGELSHSLSPSRNFKEVLFSQYGRNSLVEYDFISKIKDPLLTGFSVKYPLLNNLIMHSDSIIVHSDFAKNKVREHLFLKDIYKVNQLYHLTMGPELSNRSKKKFGVFGHVDPQKMVHLVIRIFTKFLKEKLDVELHIYGKVNKHYAECFPEEFVTNEFLDKGIYFHGFQLQSDLNSNLSQVDSVIALRSPTMGETSAIVMKSLQYGIPTIVSDVGWYSELPKFVIKVSNNHLEKELDYKVRELMENSPGVSLAQELDFNEMINDYSSILIKISKNLHIDRVEKVERKIKSILEECFLSNDGFVNDELSIMYDKIIREIR